MANNKEFPLALIIKAVDKATAPLRKINANIARFTAPVKKLNNSFKAFSEEAGFPKLKEGFKGVGSAVGKVRKEAFALGAKLFALAGVASFALFSVVRGAVDAGDKLGEMAQRVGMGVDAYASLQHAAAQMDISPDQFNASMDQFNKRLGELRAGTGPLKALGATFAAQLKGAKNNEAAFGLAVKAMEKMKTPAEKAALASVMFGRAGLQMGQFLGQGTAAIEKQRARFLELAGSQEDFAKGAGDLDNAMRETELAFTGLRNAAAGALFPALTELSKALTEVVAGNRESLRKWAEETGKAITAWVKRGGVKDLVNGLRDLAKTVGVVVDKLGGLKTVAIAAGVVMAGPLISSVVGLVGSLWSLGAALVPVVARFTILAAGLLGKVALGILEFNFGPMLAGFSAASASVWAFTAALLANPVTWVVVALAALGLAGYQIYKNWEPLKVLFSELWDTLKQIVTAVSKGDFAASFKTVGKYLGFESAYSNEGNPAGIPPPSPRPMINAPAAPPPQGSKAHVTVAFENAPKGTRIAPDRNNTASLETLLSMGPAMSGG